MSLVKWDWVFVPFGLLLILLALFLPFRKTQGNLKAALWAIGCLFAIAFLGDLSVLAGLTNHHLANDLVYVQDYKTLTNALIFSTIDFVVVWICYEYGLKKFEKN